LFSDPAQEDDNMRANLVWPHNIELSRPAESAQPRPYLPI
jgi:hypothetical protein